MQQFGLTKPHVESTVFPAVPEAGVPSSATARMVPESFDDWLAIPAQTITSNEEPELEQEQGLFMALMNECQPQVNNNSAIRARQR
jgi:hypothetical protein